MMILANGLLFWATLYSAGNIVIAQEAQTTSIS